MGPNAQRMRAAGKINKEQANARDEHDEFIGISLNHCVGHKHVNASLGFSKLKLTHSLPKSN